MERGEAGDEQERDEHTKAEGGDYTCLGEEGGDEVLFGLHE